MAIDPESCSGAVSEEASAEFRLGSLQRRPQLEFEIDFFERILSRDPNYVEVLMQLGDLFSRKGCHRRALQADLRLSQLRPRDAVVFYNLACSQAVLQQKVESLESLERAVGLGYDDVEYLAADPDLELLRSEPAFLRIVAELEVASAECRGG